MTSSIDLSSLNLTMSNSSDSHCAHCDTTVDISIKIAALCVIMVGALLCNSLVISVFLTNPSLHKTVNYFLVNMAISDLLCPIVAIPKRLVMLITRQSSWQVKGTAGLILCKVQPLLQDLSLAVSILSIICITVDRFYAVKRPLRISLIPDKARCLTIVLIWLLAFLNYSPYLDAFELAIYHGKTYCNLKWTPKSVTIFITYVAVLYGVLPWILVVILYGFIMVCLRRAKVRMQANAQSLMQHRRTASVTRQAFAIVFAFAVCTFPQTVIFMILAYYYKFTYSPLPYWPQLYFATEFMLFANSVLNPCICLFLNENYRNGLWRLLRRSDRIHPDVVREEIPIENLTRSTVAARQ
ncbi:QRFP-like peptide receptor isoform X2 [Exaiptasia diaphana]|uniref:G-protein coupled receptors family 1 profile domain-containing protein n=1 Tax=Exaiptasia diaphana TaxID=2652724 RepID=A0A913YZ50_EXADI|nr:QRFP-like peptide receptor isoform X2 [Exaiptasia diaphana]